MNSRLSPQRTTLDHVALRVTDRDVAAAELLDRFDMHVIERTERFTLVGAHEGHGKLTLLDAEGDDPPQADRIVSLVLAETPGTVTSPATLASGLVLTFAGTDQLGGARVQTPRHALVGVSLRAADPPIAAAELEACHGMHVHAVTRDHAVLDVGSSPGDGRITLSRERWDAGPGPSMLDHIGIRVADAGQWRADAELAEAGIVRWVEAPHSKAVFVSGPDDLLIEFVEQTAPFGAPVPMQRR